MATLYVTSTETFSGKSALCVGIAKRLHHDGFRIGYMKPVSTGARLAAVPVDEDAVFFKQTFNLPDSLDDMVPIGLMPQAVEAVLTGEDKTDYVGKLHAAYERISQSRDVVVLEGGSNLREGYLIGLPTPQVARRLGASALVVVKYNDDLQILASCSMPSRANVCRSFRKLPSQPWKRVGFRSWPSFRRSACCCPLVWAILWNSSPVRCYAVQTKWMN